MLAVYNAGRFVHEAVVIYFIMKKSWKFKTNVPMSSNIEIHEILLKVLLNVP